MRIFLGLGSNLGDRDMNLVNARDLLMKHDVLVVGQSDVRETEPLGGMDQPKYLNQVVEVITNLEPEELLMACKAVEKEMGRPIVVKVANVSFGSTKKEERWAPRIIDIDILYYGDIVMDSLDLKIPHYGNPQRHFVLEGMLDLAPEFVDPKEKKTVEELLRNKLR